VNVIHSGTAKVSVEEELDCASENETAALHLTTSETRTVVSCA
jgi:hypothetical protein